MSRLAVYTLANCDTCRRAVKWLRARGQDFEERPIRDTPPTRAELRTMLAAQGGDRRRLFNTAGREYRELKLAEKLPALTDGSGQDGSGQNLIPGASATAQLIDVAQVQGQVHAQSVHRVGELAERNPNETATIVRQWLAEPAA